MEMIEKLRLEIEEVVVDLLKVAECLAKMSSTQIVQEELLSSQDKQDALIGRLTCLNGELEEYHAKEGGEVPNPLLGEKVMIELDRFQVLNQSFISNLEVRQGLIKFELDETQKNKQVLGEVQDAYGGSEELSRAARPKSRLDTRS